VQIQQEQSESSKKLTWKEIHQQGCRSDRGREIYCKWKDLREGEFKKGEG